MQGTRSRAVIAADSLRIDRWWESAWEDLHRWPGPERHGVALEVSNPVVVFEPIGLASGLRSEEHTSELQSQSNLVCRLLLEKKKKSVRQVTCSQTDQHKATRH